MTARIAPLPKARSPQLPAVAPPAPHRALFGPPPLFEGEDAAAYDALLERVAGAVDPADVLEEIWVRDVVDLAWDALRLRRLKASLMTAAAHEGLENVLTPLLGFAAARELAVQWVGRERGIVKRVDKLLAGAGLTMDAVAAGTLAVRIDDIERIDRMIMMAEARRAAALREVDRHRASVAQALRRALDDVEDAAFEDVARDDAPSNGGRRNGAGSVR